jgi:flagellar transcriptional activator FlhC
MSDFKPKKSVIDDAMAVQKAVALVKLGARLQVLQAELPSLSRDRLLSVYKEIRGNSPPKGQLPFSTDWFLNWAPNTHSSLFMGIFNQMAQRNPATEQIDLLVASYTLYLQTVKSIDNPAILTLTRAWRLYRFCAAGVLTLHQCKHCAGKFIVDPYDLNTNYECVFCEMDTRVGPKVDFEKKMYQELDWSDEQAA